MVCRSHKFILKCIMSTKDRPCKNCIWMLLLFLFLFYKKRESVLKLCYARFSVVNGRFPIPKRLSKLPMNFFAYFPGCFIIWNQCQIKLGEGVFTHFCACIHVYSGTHPPIRVIKQFWRPNGLMAGELERPIRIILNGYCSFD